MTTWHSHISVVETSLNTSLHSRTFVARDQLQQSMVPIEHLQPYMNAPRFLELYLLRPFCHISRAFGTAMYPTMHFTLPSDNNSGKNRKSFKIQTFKCALWSFLLVYLVLRHGNTLYLTPSACGKERAAPTMSPLWYNFIVLRLYNRVDWVSLASLLR